MTQQGPNLGIGPAPSAAGPGWREALALLAERTSQAVIVTDAEERIEWANDAFIRSFGFALDEIVGRVPGDVLQGPGTDPQTVSFMADRIAERRSFVTEVLNYTKSGEARWIQLEVVPVFDDAGRLARFASLQRDITDLRRVTESLASSRTTLDRVLRTTPVGIYAADAVRDDAGNIRDFEITLANERGERLAGHEPGTMVGARLRSLHPGVDAAGAFDFYREVVETGATLQREITYRHEGLDGTFSVAASKLGDGFTAAVTDITPRQRDAQRLREQADLLDLVHDGIISIDGRGSILAWNAGMERIAGVATSEAAARPLGHALPLADPDAEDWRDVLSDLHRSPRHEREIDLLRRTGDAFTALVRLSPREPRPAAGGVLLVLDITETRRLEADLRHAQRIEALGRLAAGVAHDVTNLINAVRYAADAADAMLEPGHPASAQLAQIEQAIEQASQLTVPLLQYARRSKPERRSLDLARTAEAAADLARASLGGGVRLELHPPDGPVFAAGDESQLRQVVLNLSLNARDAMPDGGVLRIAVGATPPTPDAPNGHALITVEDTGSGMQRDVAERIFDPFYTTKPRGRGTGLGLAIVHAIVRDHGGSIDVRTAPGAGTTVRVLLPRIDATQPTRGPDAQAPPVRIAVMDSNAQRAAALASALEHAGYEVIARPDDSAPPPADADVLVVSAERPADQSGHVVRRLSRRATPPASCACAVLPHPFDADALLDAVRRVADPARAELRDPGDREDPA